MQHMYMHLSMQETTGNDEIVRRSKDAKGELDTANSRVHRLLTFDTRGRFSLDSMGSFVRGVMSMIHVHSRC